MAPRDAAVVTGGGRGIGRAIALALAGAGFGVTVLARSPGELGETRAELERKGAPTLAVSCDVRDEAAVAEAVSRTEAEIGPVSLLVNNAGTGRALGPLWTVDADDWWTDVETSLRGAFHACRAVIPGMIDRGAGRIVNIASYVAVRPAPYQTGYAAGKAALVNLTEALAESLASHGIRVFAFSPGYVETEMTRRMRESPWLPDLGSGRVLTAEEGASVVAAIASGRLDALSGRFLHTLDDVDAILGRLDEVERDDLYVPRLRRLQDEE